MGDCEIVAPVAMESPLEYHTLDLKVLTMYRYPVLGHCQMGSLTGAVAS